MDSLHVGPPVGYSEVGLEDEAWASLIGLGTERWWQQPPPDHLDGLDAERARLALEGIGAWRWTLWAAAAFGELLGAPAALPDRQRDGHQVVALAEPNSWLEAVPAVQRLRELAALPAGRWPGAGMAGDDAGQRWTAMLLTLHQVDLVVELTDLLRNEGYADAADIVAEGCTTIIQVLVPDLDDDEPDPVGSSRGRESVWYVP